MRFVHGWKRQVTYVIYRKKSNAQSNNWKLSEDETICSKDDARCLSNILQPIRYPATDQYDLHRKIFDCMQDPQKCLSKRHNNHIHVHSQSFQEFLQNFSCIQYSESQKSLYKWERISIYRSLKYIKPRSKKINGQDHKITPS